MSETNTQIWLFEFSHPAPDRRLFRREPGIDVLLPDIHRTAHDDKQVKIIQRWNDVALVELDDIQFAAADAPEASEDADMLHREVLKHQYSHLKPRSGS